MLRNEVGMSDTLTPPATKQGSAPPRGTYAPKHGAGRPKPVRKGEQARDPNGNRGSDYVETLLLARQAAPDAMRKLIAKMDSEDERVAVAAQQAVLDRAWRRPRDYAPREERPNLWINATIMSTEERRFLLALLRRGLVKEAGAEPDAVSQREPAMREGSVQVDG